MKSRNGLLIWGCFIILILLGVLLIPLIFSTIKTQILHFPLYQTPRSGTAKNRPLSFSFSDQSVSFQYATYDEKLDKDSDQFIASFNIDDYPLLFSNIQDLSWIKITPIPASYGKYLLLNVYPDHGGSSISHAMVVDIFSEKDKVLYRTPSTDKFVSLHMGAFEDGDLWLKFSSPYSLSLIHISHTLYDTAKRISP